MPAEGRSGREPQHPPSSATSRLLGIGARGAGRVASATGVDRALEDALEEAIVRAMRSPAVERAVIRVIEQNAVQEAFQRTLTSDEIADAVVGALDSELADRIWVELLASPKAQMLVERIAEAPEVRAAIAQQGVGLITDIGHRLTAITESLDDLAERVAHALIRRPNIEETDQVGLITRGLAFGLDVAIIALVLSIASSLLHSFLPASLHNGWTWQAIVVGVVLGGASFVLFWGLVGQTPGMRLLSIHLEVAGSRELGTWRALKRLVGLALSLIPLGLGVLAILVSPTRRGWHDRIAGTEVAYDARGREAPWSHPGRDAASAGGAQAATGSVRR
jgi:uncharacterized RDD family membrane protein YckC